jgi:small subunit ribosomal protein S19e
MRSKQLEKNMSQIYEIPAQKYNDLLAAKLKNMDEFKMPEWALYVKTSVSKLRPPINNDWWYNRAASILRQIAVQGIVGVGRLRVKYGSRKNRGMKPEAFMKAGGKSIRVILQQAEKAGLLEKVKEGKRFGRRLTVRGKEFMEAIK